MDTALCQRVSRNLGTSTIYSSPFLRVLRTCVGCCVELEDVVRRAPAVYIDVVGSAGAAVPGDGL